MRRARSPLFDLGVFSARTFRAAATGGFIYRLTISAVPFLLPLMFQNGFGWDPLRAGVLVAAVFVGNIGIKPATTPLIRRFGFKPVLVFASLASAATFALCALLDAGTPEPVIFALLVASGAFRSIGFSAYASVQYADVVPAQLPSANAVSATLVQLAAAAGIAIGALLIRVAEAGGPLLGGPGAAGDPAAPYRAAFLAIAVVMLLSTLDSLLLPRHAGAEVSRPGPAPAAAPRRRPRA
jgi:MFS family permease